MIFRRLLHVVL